jgi:hypothetical protein
MISRAFLAKPASVGSFRETAAALTSSCIEHFRMMQTVWAEAMAMQREAIRRYPYLDW